MTTAIADDSTLVDGDIGTKGYRRPDVLVSTAWLAARLDDPRIRLLESNEDTLLYGVGHIPGALEIDWHRDLNDAVVRDYVGPAEFETLLRRLGIDESTTVVLYGDKHNWWATYTFWVFRLFDFPEHRLRILDGGRAKWEREGRRLVAEVPSVNASTYAAGERNDARIRAFKREALEHSWARKPLIDVRSPDEYSGKTTHMAEYPQEGVLRGGHIPGAVNVPWARAANADGTFKAAGELRELYEAGAGLDESDSIITYCRIGERSSHSWFVLTYLLGYRDVRNYDGSWTEWGNSVQAPIER
jgi:thiosulfate/3-mercaptopyruvate sulfurtransferase